jgi:hypothetical protein
MLALGLVVCYLLVPSRLRTAKSDTSTWCSLGVIQDRSVVFSLDPRETKRHPTSGYVCVPLVLDPRSTTSETSYGLTSFKEVDLSIQIGAKTNDLRIS